MPDRSELRTKAAHGDAHAQYELGVLLEHEERKHADARDYYQRAADQFHPAAMAGLGRVVGIDHDAEMAFAWFALAVAFGDTSARADWDKLTCTRAESARAYSHALVWLHENGPRHPDPESITRIKSSLREQREGFDPAYKRLPAEEHLCFELARDSSDAHIRAIALSEVFTPELLAEVALHAASSIQRVRAITRVKDTNVLADVLSGDDDSGVQLAAFERFLALVAGDSAETLRLAREGLESKAAAIRSLALDVMLTHSAAPVLQTLLVSLAFDDISSEIRWKAAEHITDHQVLRKLLGETSDSSLRLDLAIRLGDEETLEEIATEDPHDRVRVDAAAALTSEAQFERLLIRSSDPAVRMFALSRIQNEDTLIRLCLEETDEEVRATAFERLSEPALVQLLETSVHRTMNLEAVGRMEKVACLAQVVRRHWRSAWGRYALARLYLGLNNAMSTRTLCRDCGGTGQGSRGGFLAGGARWRSRCDGCHGDGFNIHRPGFDALSDQIIAALSAVEAEFPDSEQEWLVRALLTLNHT